MVGKTTTQTSQPKNPGGPDQWAQPPVPALNVEVTISLIYLGNFWMSLDFSLIKFDIKLDLLWTKYFLLTRTNDDITGSLALHFMLSLYQ